MDMFQVCSAVGCVICHCQCQSVTQCSTNHSQLSAVSMKLGPRGDGSVQVKKRKKLHTVCTTHFWPSFILWAFHGSCGGVQRGVLAQLGVCVQSVLGGPGEVAPGQHWGLFALPPLTSRDSCFVSSRARATRDCLFRAACTVRFTLTGSVFSAVLSLLFVFGLILLQVLQL